MAPVPNLSGTLAERRFDGGLDVIGYLGLARYYHGPYIEVVLSAAICHLEPSDPSGGLPAERCTLMTDKKEDRPPHL